MKTSSRKAQKLKAPHSPDKMKGFLDMATTSIVKHIPVPKRRFRGIPVAIASLNGSQLVLASGCFYAAFLAFLVGWLYPTLTNLNLSAYLTSNTMSGLLGAKLTHISGYTAFIAIEMYSAFYGLIWGGIVAYIAGAALPATIENGTLDLALARPISRTRYYLQIWFGALLSAFILIAFTRLY